MQKFETRYGFPVVNRENIFPILEELGIKKWPSIRGPMPLQTYKCLNLTPKEHREIDKFAPYTEVEIFKDPDDAPFVGFRAVWNNGHGCVVFTLLPGDLVPIAAEFRHGARVVSLIFPGGVKEKNDPSLASCGKREFEAETGIQLQEVISLDDGGTPLSARGLELCSCSFLGIAENPVVVKKQDLDSKEFLQIVLVPLEEWLHLIKDGLVKESASIVATFLALNRLGRLKIV